MENSKFKLLFKDRVFNKGNTISNGTPYRNTPWYLEILGFTYVWECKVLSDPIPDGENYMYDIQYLRTKLKWFKWTVKNINNEK